jgi:lysophospholipase L1-like esterase
MPTKLSQFITTTNIDASTYIPTITKSGSGLANKKILGSDLLKPVYTRLDNASPLGIDYNIKYLFNDNSASGNTVTLATCIRELYFNSNLDSSLNIKLCSFARNSSNEWKIVFYNDVSGTLTQIAQFDQTGYTENSIIPITLYNSSTICGYVNIDWNRVNDGTSLSGMNDDEFLINKKCWDLELSPTISSLVNLNSLSASGYLYLGVATTSTVPATYGINDRKYYSFNAVVGSNVLTNFGLTITETEDSIYSIKWNGTEWISDKLPLCSQAYLDSLNATGAWSFKPSGFVTLGLTSIRIAKIRYSDIKTSLFFESDLFTITVDPTNQNEYLIADISNGSLVISKGIKSNFWSDTYSNNVMLFAYKNDGRWTSDIAIVQSYLDKFTNYNTWYLEKNTVAISGANVTFSGVIRYIKSYNEFSGLAATQTLGCSGDNDYIIASGLSTDGGNIILSKGTRAVWWQEIPYLTPDTDILCFKSGGKWESHYVNIAIALNQAYLDSLNATGAWSFKPSGFVTLGLTSIRIAKIRYSDIKTSLFFESDLFTITVDPTNQNEYLIADISNGSLVISKGIKSNFWSDTYSNNVMLFAYKNDGRWTSDIAIVQSYLDKFTNYNTWYLEKNTVAISGANVTFSGVIRYIKSYNEFSGLAATQTLGCSGDNDYIIASGLSTDGGNIILSKGTRAVWWQEIPYLTPDTDILCFKSGGKWESHYVNIAIALNQAYLDSLNATKIPSQSLLKYISASNLSNDFYSNCYFLGKWFTNTLSGNLCTSTITAGGEFYFSVLGTTVINLLIINNDVSYSPYISVSIDGGSFERYLLGDVGSGENLIQIATDLSTDKHYIRCVVDALYEHEIKWLGGIGFSLKGITIDSGATINPCKPNNKKILFIGDSITEGIHVTGSGDSPIVNSATLSYPFIAASLLNAVTLRNGYGGSGITVAGSGACPKAIDTLDWAMNNVSLIMDTPDLIIINHGTNDSSADSSTFQTAYDLLIKKLQIKYPSALIFCMRPYNGTHSNDVSAISNNDGCIFIDTSTWGVTYTDGTHPNQVGSSIAGSALAKFLINEIGISYFIS